MNKKIMKIGISLFGIVAVAGIILAFTRDSTPANAEVISMPPATEIVSRNDITEIVSASGTVAAAEENGIYIATTQKVSKVNVSLGDVVNIGDILVEYDIDYSKKELENSLQQQQITLTNSQLSLASMTSSLSEAEILQYESNIQSAEKSLFDAQTSYDSLKLKISQAQADVDKAQKDVTDNKILLDAGAIAQSEYTSYVDAYEKALDTLTDYQNEIPSYEKNIETAETSLTQAQRNYELALDPLNTSSSQIQYQQQQNEIAKAQLTIQSIQEQLNDLTTASVALTSGTVIQVNVEEGSIVSDETTIVKIADLDRLIVEANVSEYDAPLIQVGQKVTMTTDAIENQYYEGTVSYVSPIAQVTSTFSGSETTVAIEVAIDNPDGVLKPGYTVDMDIVVYEAADVLNISLSAVQKDKEMDSYYVFLVDQAQKLKKQSVEIGTTDDMTIEILSGLQEGDMIVSSPTAEMEENTSLLDYETTVTIDTSAMPDGMPANGDSSGFGGMMQGGGGDMPGGGSMPSGGGMLSGGGMPGGMR